MKFKLSLTFMFIILLLLLHSCSKKSDNITKIQYPQYTVADKDDITEDESYIDDTQSDTVFNFIGIPSDALTPTLGNLGINLKMSNKLVLVCPDFNNEKIYYINHGQDGFIYELDGNNSSLLLDKKAMSIQLWDNELYFIENDSSEDRPINPDALYKLDLDTMELKLIHDTQVNWMIVSSAGINCNNMELSDEMGDDGHRNLTMNSLFFDFDNENIENSEYFEIAFYKDYLYRIDRTDIYSLNGTRIFENLSRGEEIEIASNEPIFPGDSIYEDNLYYIDKDQKLIRINLVNGNRYEYDIRSFP